MNDFVERGNCKKINSAPDSVERDSFEDYWDFSDVYKKIMGLYEHVVEDDED